MLKNWYALYTKPRWEKKVDGLLTKKGIESWCPLQKVTRQWSDRKKIIEEPLFKSYVFVQIDLGERTQVLMTDGVLNFVHYVGKPAIIRNEEIEIIKKYLSESGTTISVQSLSSLDLNTRIKVNQGIFMEIEGTVVKGSNRKVYIELESLGQVMIVKFPIEHVTPIV